MSSRKTDRKPQERAQTKVTAYNRLKKPGKRDGTPEKSASPSQEENSENRPPSRNVIWNEEIEKLQIKEEELNKLHEPRPPAERKKTPVPSTVTVRKLKPASEWDKPKPKLVTVAKPAPFDAPVKPVDHSGFAGPRYHNDGSVISHSILGTYEDFHREAIKKGDLIDLPCPREVDSQSQVPTLKYEKKKSRSEKIRAQANENNALRNWQLRMLERKKQQGYISKLLQKAPEDLTMNQAENFRYIQEQRYIIDRTIPTMDYGKGYRVGSEFWKQEERFGDETQGIHMTLTQTEKGYPTPVEHVGIPDCVRQEKGATWHPNYTAPVFYPWHKAPFYEKRKKQLQSVIGELDSHQPEFDQLQVIGTNDPYGKKVDVDSDSGLTERDESEKYRNLESELQDEYPQDPLHDHPDVHPAPIFGPSLQIAGQPARWTGDSYSFKDQMGIQARISFESYTGERITSYLEIINDGTTSIYYDWKQLPKDNPFDLVQASVQRFYFNNSSGVILPGETMKFPFVFKSPNAGVFTEQWKFETRPVVCGGADLIVTLRGVALQEDIYQKHRQELERDLQSKQANQIVQQILNDLIDAIRMPDRPRSPVDAYITEEEIFRRHNAGMHYNHEVVEELKQMYLQLFPEEDRVGKFWDLCVQDLKDLIMALDEDDERKEPFLHRLNEAVGKMSYTPNHPIQQQLYNIGYEYLLEAMDSIVGQSMLIRQTLGLPEKETDEFPDGDLRNDREYSWTSMSSTATQDTSKLAVPRKPPSRTSSVGEEGDSRRGKTADKSKADAKDKKSAPGKDPKAAKGGKETPKLDPKKAPPGPKKPPSRGPVVTPGPAGSDKERTMSPTSSPPTPVLDTDPVMEKKYREKLYCQAFTVIGDAVERMDSAFGNMLRNKSLDRFKPT